MIVSGDRCVETWPDRPVTRVPSPTSRVGIERLRPRLSRDRAICPHTAFPPERHQVFGSTGPD